jgi:hypothetical protein
VFPWRCDCHTTVHVICNILVFNPLQEHAGVMLLTASHHMEPYQLALQPGVASCTLSEPTRQHVELSKYLHCASCNGHLSAHWQVRL